MSLRISLIFPNQLFETSNLLNDSETIYLIEEYLFFKQYNFHKQKIAFHRATMKMYEKHLKSLGKKVIYINSYEKTSDVRQLIKTFSKNEINIYNPVDSWLEKRIKNETANLHVPLKVFENPLFINKNDELTDFFKPTKKKFFQTSFYISQRKKYNILLNSDGLPKGGKWSFDTENRKKYPKKKKAPKFSKLEITQEYKDAVEYVSKYYSNNIGELSSTEQIYPIDFNTSKKWLHEFLTVRFVEFGTYEDAIVKEESFLNHSILTPMLNTGLISPKHIINEALKYAKSNNTPINSIEGFIRQIIGWREFMRGMYVVKGTQQRTTNYWNFKRKIPASFYNGTTGIEPIDMTIKKILKTGYSHHIERLMILGNFMVLCEFDPDEVYRWFMELFIDSYDWVMVPNVYGMSQFSDGGLLATKPYISGSNYIKKMSDYKIKEWGPIWDGLFWSFMDKHRDFFLSNPRLSMLIKNFDKLSADKKEEHTLIAENYLNSLSPT